MSTFFSYVLCDTVAIEPVYFPTGPQAATTTAAAEIDDRSTAPSSLLQDRRPYTLTLRDVLLHRLTERYVGRVIAGRGLCVAIAEVLDYSASEVKGFAASAWLTATFQVCVFAPSPGTRLVAHVARQTPAGIYLRLDFFAAFPFIVPASLLVSGSVYDGAQSAWYLPFEAADEDEDDEEHPKERRSRSSGGDRESGGGAPALGQRNYYAMGEAVLVQVDACTVRSEDALVPPVSSMDKMLFRSPEDLGESLADRDSGAEEAAGGPAVLPPLMEIQGTFIGDGLGPMSWFEEAGE